MTSFSELRRDGLDVERWNMLHPSRKPRAAYVSEQLSDRRGPVIASTDYLRAVPDQIRQWVAREGTSYRTLGTDGYGRSDFRTALRRFFEVDRHYVAVAALKGAADAGTVDRKLVAQAIKKYEIDADGAAYDRMSATLTKVEVPDIGDFDDVPIIEILVSVGDSVAVEDPLVTLESDKATMDVPAPTAGVVARYQRVDRRSGVGGAPC